MIVTAKIFDVSSYLVDKEEVKQMNKTIEKIESYKAKQIEKALSKAKSDYENAKDFYRDTGYDRYLKKMNKCEDEIQELEDYLYKDKDCKKDLSTEEYTEYKKIKSDLSCIKSKVDYLSKEFPVNSTLIGLVELLKDY